MDVVSVVRAEWDRVAGWTLIAAGFICLVLAYLGVARSPFIAEELTYVISGGLGGLLLLGGGGTLLLIADLHDEWRKLDRIQAAIGESVAPPAGRLPVQVGRAALATGAGYVVAGIIVIVAWSRAGQIADPKPALEDLALAIVGLVVAGATSVGTTLWLKAAVKRRQSRLLAPWELAVLAQRVHGFAATNGSAVPSDSARLVTVAGLSRYHREGCPAVRGLVIEAVAPDHVPEDLRPCQLCDAGVGK